LYGVFIDRTSGVGLTHSAHCSSLGSVAPTGRVSKWAGRPAATVVPGDADACAVDEGATVLVASGAELGVTVVAPPLEQAPSAAATRKATTTRLLQRPPGIS